MINIHDILYFRLHGSYFAINRGHARDPLVDFTGGISETYNIRKDEDLPPNLFDIVLKSFEVGSLICASMLVRF